MEIKKARITFDERLVRDPKKLKTLKDMQQHSHMNHRTGRVDGYVCMEDLKELAIKWVKWKNKRLDDNDWVNFFNITEEDLK